MMGRVAKLSQHSVKRMTTLQWEIQRFVLYIAFFAILTAAACLAYWGGYLQHAYPGFLNISLMLSTDMGVLVAYVPEGLPIAVTLVLTIIAHRMRLQRVLVKSLTTVETLGCVNVLLSDKTGTLTTNQMCVSWWWCIFIKVCICTEGSSPPPPATTSKNRSATCPGPTLSSRTRRTSSS